MANYNSLNWQNENTLSGYPFDSELDIQGFIVDARFIQFDNFIPALKSAYIDTDRITLAVSFDYGEATNLVFLKSKYSLGEPYRHIRIYQPSNNRYLGDIVFGEGVEKLWQEYIGQRLSYNALFSAETVRSIPSKDAVYLFDSSYGDITLGRTALDRSVFYNVSEELNSITFNAVAGHSVTEAVNSGTSHGLKQINLVKPLNNNINLASNDIVKITTVNASSLQISLVAGSKSTAFAIPSLIA
jgi:hypothetical protein